MAEYCGIVQSMIRVRRDLYSLTFRVHEEGAEGKEGDFGTGGERNVYTAEIELRGDGFSVVPEKELDECMRLLDEYPGQVLAGTDVYRKRIVGMIADEIFGRIREDRTLQVRSWIEIDSAGQARGVKRNVRR